MMIIPPLIGSYFGISIRRQRQKEISSPTALYVSLRPTTKDIRLSGELKQSSFPYDMMQSEFKTMQNKSIFLDALSRISNG
jgi:hypothetical protein